VISLDFRSRARHGSMTKTFAAVSVYRAQRIGAACSSWLCYIARENAGFLKKIPFIELVEAVFLPIHGAGVQNSQIRIEF
jgi:hypothetical protein